VDGNGVVQLVATGGFATIIAAIIGAVAGQRVQKANAGNIAIQSADTQIENLTSDNDRLRRNMREADERLLAAESRAERLAAKVRGWWERADRMMAWVRRQEARLAEQGIHDPAPALYPPDGE
jgi:hypothetical protein